MSVYPFSDADLSDLCQKLKHSCEQAMASPCGQRVGNYLGRKTVKCGLAVTAVGFGVYVAPNLFLVAALTLASRKIYQKMGEKDAEIARLAHENASLRQQKIDTPVSSAAPAVNLKEEELKTLLVIAEEQVKLAIDEINGNMLIDEPARGQMKSKINACYDALRSDQTPQAIWDVLNTQYPKKFKALDPAIDPRITWVNDFLNILDEGY